VKGETEEEQVKQVRRVYQVFKGLKDFQDQEVSRGSKENLVQWAQKDPGDELDHQVSQVQMGIRVSQEKMALVA